MSLCFGYYSHDYFEKPVVLLENDHRFINIYQKTYKLKEKYKVNYNDSEYYDQTDFERSEEEESQRKHEEIQLFWQESQRWEEETRSQS